MGIYNMLSTPWGKLAFLDVFVITTYMLFCLYIGFRKSGKISNIREFALGNGQISTFLLVATIYATHLGAGMTFGTIEKIKDIGILFALAMVVSPIGWMIAIWVFGANIEQFKGCLSLNDIMHKLYGSGGRWATNIVSLFIAVGTIAAQAHAIGYVIHYYLNIPVTYGILSGIGVLILYSAFGGVRAVALTDLLQFMVFYIAIPYMCAVGFQKIHSLADIQNAISPEKLSMEITGSNIALFIGVIIYSELFGSGSTFIQRYLMAQNSKQLLQALKVVAALDLVMILILCFLGALTVTLLPQATSSKTAFLEMVSLSLPIGLKGFLIVGLLAVIMSTADSWLNTTSVLCAHDIAKQIWPNLSEKAELRLARLATVVIGGLSIMLALSGAGILEIIWFADNFYAPVIFFPLVAGFLGFRTNAESFKAAVICAMAFTLSGAYFQGAFDVVSLTLGLIGSAIGLFGVHHYQVKAGKIDRRLLPRNEDDVWERRPTLSRRIMQEGMRKLRLKQLVLALNRTVLQDPPRYYSFAILSLVFNFLPVLMIAALGVGARPNCTMEVMIRMLAVLGCATLCFHEQWSINWKRWLPSYWYALQIWCLPVISVYSLLLYHDYTIWVPYFILAMVMLAAFAHNVLLLLITSSLGAVIGAVLVWSQVQFLGENTLPAISNKLGYNVLVLICLVFSVAIAMEMVLRILSMKSLSLFDKLSTLRNRRYIDMHFGDVIDDAIESGTPLSLMLIDADKFGNINKDYCQQSGDMVLQELGKTIKGAFWNSDLCARYGGEEFLVVLRDTDLDGGLKAAERLRKTVQNKKFPIFKVPYQIVCTVSIGVATLRPEDTVKSLIARANEALLIAKQTGRNQVVTEDEAASGAILPEKIEASMS